MARRSSTLVSLAAVRDPLSRRVADAAARWELTGRERDVLLHLCNGDTNKEIAVRLAMSPRTVEHHVASILRKAGAESRVRLVARVWRGPRQAASART